MMSRYGIETISHEMIDQNTHIHFCDCGARITYTGHDHGSIIDCACGRKYDVEQINGHALIFDRDAGD